MKTSAGFFEGIKPIPLGFSYSRFCSQFSLWEWSRKKMTSPILVMNFYSRLNCKYVNLIPRWSPKYMYHQTIDPDTLFGGLSLLLLQFFFAVKHRANINDCTSPGLFLSVYKDVACLSWCPFTKLKHSQPSNNFKDWLRTVNGMGSQPYFSFRHEMTSIQNTFPHNIANISQLGFY